MNLICLDCDNTEMFYRTFTGSVAFSNTDNMTTQDLDFSEWSSRILCDDCHSDNVKEVK